jgi:YVTN family beta-propeller protein
VTDFSQDMVFVIDLRTHTVLPESIQVGDGPENVIFSPDGAHAYVSNAEDGTVSDISTGRGAVTRTITVGKRPEGIAITPDGRTVYVANDNSGTVSAIDTATDTLVGPPIEVGEGPDQVAMSPDGAAVYVSNFESDSVSVIDPRTNEVSTTVQIGEGEEPLAIAVSPDSRTWYVTTIGDQMVRGFSAGSESPLGEPITAGVEPVGLLFRPDQPPNASFSSLPLARPGLPVSFDASASRDGDGSIADYSWSFGDGAAAASGGPMPAHAYSSPGTYRVRLTLTDEEGCATASVFTGQVVSCNGSDAASAVGSVVVAFPAVRVRCPGRAGRRGCRFRLRAVTRRRHGRAESAVARVKVIAGRSALVSLKPKARFADRFSIGDTALIRLTSRIASTTQTRVAALRIVG